VTEHRAAGPPGGLPRRPVAPASNDPEVMRRLGFALAGQFLGSSRWDGMLLNIRSSQVNLNSTITIPGRLLHQALTAYPNGTVAALAPHRLWMLPEGDEHVPWVLDELSIRANERGELLISPLAPTPQAPPARVVPAPPGPSSPPPGVAPANVPVRPPAAARPPTAAPPPPKPAPPAEDEAPLKGDTFFVLQQFTTAPGPPTMPTTAYKKPPIPTPGQKTEYTMPVKPPPPPREGPTSPEKRAKVRDVFSDIREGAHEEDTSAPALPPEEKKPRYIPDMRMKKEIGPGFLAGLGILPGVDDVFGASRPPSDSKVSPPSPLRREDLERPLWDEEPDG